MKDLRDLIDLKIHDVQPEAVVSVNLKTSAVCVNLTNLGRVCQRNKARLSLLCRNSRASRCDSLDTGVPRS